ncbi:MAG: MFS transporter [Actinobacteria bacterium]|nr:MFS transporter [Actinomycetota bacterium]
MTMTAPTAAVRTSRVTELMGIRYLVLAFIARLPFAMAVVGVLLLLVGAGRTVAEGGLVSAVIGIGTAAGAPLLGRAVERFGQRPVLLVIAPVFGVLLVAIVPLTWLEAPVALLLAVAALAGISSPQVAPLSRSRVTAAAPTASPTTLDAAMAYESMADEGAFVVGPALVGVLSASSGPYAPLLVAAALTFSAVVVFALHPTASAPEPAHDAAQAPRGALVTGWFVLLVAGMATIGALFGTTLTSLTRWMELQHMPDLTGVVYGIMSVGSIIAAVVLPKIPVAVLPRRMRWVVCSAVGGVGLVVLASTTTMVATCVGLLVLGCGIGGALVTVFGLAAHDVAASRRTSAFAILAAALIVSQAVTTALCGQLVTAAGPLAGYVAGLGAGAVLLALALARLARGAVSAAAPSPRNG